MRRPTDQYDKALRSADDPSKAAHLRGDMLRAAEAHQRNREMKEAASLYGRAERLGTLTPEQSFNYGEALLALGHHGNAAMQFMNVLAVRPEDRAAQDLLLSCEAYQQFYADTNHFIVTEVPFGGVTSAFCATPFGEGIVVAAEQPVLLERSEPLERALLPRSLFRKEAHGGHLGRCPPATRRCERAFPRGTSHFQR